MKVQKPIDIKNLTPLETTHWPQISPLNPQIGKKFIIKVRIGQKPHPMTADHLILYIELYAGNKPIGKKFLKPGDLPEAEFTVLLEKPTKIIAHSFCNLHGLCENQKEISRPR